MNQNVKLFLRKHPLLYQFVGFLYSLRKEDRAFRALVKRRLGLLLMSGREITLIQVGSNDGGHGDPLQKYLRRHQNIRAVLVEPVDYIFNRLEQRYANKSNIQCLRTAVVASLEEEPPTFYYVDPVAKQELGDVLPVWWDQLGSFNRDNIVKHLDGILEPYIRSLAIDYTTIDNICRDQGFEQLDVLHTDCEGYDAALIMSLNLDRYRPALVIYESKHLSQLERKQVEEKLGHYGYHLQAFRDDTVAYVN